MTYRTMKCPNCKKYIEFRQLFLGKTYGNPFKNCPHCNSVYRDSDIEEPALFSKDQVFIEILKCLLLYLIRFFFMGFITALILSWILMSFFDSDSVFMTTMFCACIAYIIYVINQKFFMPRMKNEFTISMQRLENENYYIRLLNSGVENPSDSYYNQMKSQ